MGEYSVSGWKVEWIPSFYDFLRGPRVCRKGGNAHSQSVCHFQLRACHQMHIIVGVQFMQRHCLHVCQDMQKQKICLNNMNYFTFRKTGWRNLDSGLRERVFVSIYFSPPLSYLQNVTYPPPLRTEECLPAPPPPPPLLPWHQCDNWSSRQASGGRSWSSSWTTSTSLGPDLITEPWHTCAPAAAGFTLPTVDYSYLKELLFSIHSWLCVVTNEIQLERLEFMFL